MNSPSTKSLSHFYLSVVIIIVSIFLFDVQGTLIKLLGDRYPLPQLQFFRNFFGIFPSLLVLMLSASWHRAGRPFRIVQWKLSLARGAVLVVAQLCFYFSLLKMELATATTLAFAGPLFVSLLSVPILKHKLGFWRISAVVLGFAGVVLVMRPTTGSLSPYVFLPVCAAFCYALASVSSRLFDPEIPTTVINLYSTLTTVVITAVLMLMTSGYLPIQSLTDWILVIAMGSAGGFAVLLMIMAYRRTEPASLSPFEYFGIPFSFILGWIFFNESPFDRLFPGVLLIVAGGIVVLIRERQLERRKALNNRQGKRP